MTEFSKGERARLISGGPVMTVQDVGNYAGEYGTGPENGVNCIWFETVKGVREVRQHVFDAAVLEKVDGTGASTFRLSRA